MSWHRTPAIRVEDRWGDLVETFESAEELQRFIGCTWEADWPRGPFRVYCRGSFVGTVEETDPRNPLAWRLQPVEDGKPVPFRYIDSRT